MGNVAVNESNIIRIYRNNAKVARYNKAYDLAEYCEKRAEEYIQKIRSAEIKAQRLVDHMARERECPKCNPYVNDSEYDYRHQYYAMEEEYPDNFISR